MRSKCVFVSEELKIFIAAALLRYVSLMHNKTLIQTQHLTATYLEQCTAPSKQASHRKQGKSYSVNPITLKRDGVRQKADGQRK